MTDSLRGWATEQNPDVLLAVVTDQPGSSRRLRLFGCACVRQVWHLLTRDARSAVEISERLANGMATATDLRAAAVRLCWICHSPSQIAIEAAGYASGGLFGRAPLSDSYPLQFDPRQAARLAARAAASELVGPAPGLVTPSWHQAWTDNYNTARATQANLVRALFPPPGATDWLHPDWRTRTVLALARQIAASGDYSALPILADALEEAGCDDEFLLQCCRLPANGLARGNWVVDRLLEDRSESELLL